MAAALVKSASGVATAITVSPAFGSATTSGNIIVLSFTGDDYNVTVDSGWTEQTGMRQEGFHGCYCWWRTSAGETSFTYTIATAANSSWVISEWSGLNAAPYDISAGQFVNTSAALYTTPSITPAAADRLMIVTMGGSSTALDLSGAWTLILSSFTEVGHAGNAAGNRTCVLQASRIVTPASGSYSSGATYPTTVQSTSGEIMALKVAASATFIARQGLIISQAVRRAATF